MPASLAIPVVRRPYLPELWIERLRAVFRMSAMRGPDRHISKLSPHQLRDIGLPETLSDMAHFHPHHRFLEKFE